MEMYGVRGIPLEWFRSYLSGRSQFVEITNKGGRGRSALLPVKVGVPQGSILGPLLFNIYVNDLNSSVRGHLVQYADDTSVLIQADTAQSLSTELAFSLKSLSSWFSANYLFLNPEKTSIVHFRPHKNESALVTLLDNIPIEHSSTVCFLGLHIDSRFDWSNHISHVCQRLGASIYSLRYLTSFLSRDTVRLVYFGYFVPILTYGLIFWGTASGKLINRVFKLQKKAVRLMCGLGHRESCREVFPRESLMTLPSLRLPHLHLRTFNPSHHLTTCILQETEML
ncbi:hypothetical protein J6590_108468 [Homalodisca vitripennis]|nr:hypothetical protein J6590_108468 [Homalodisca vitripennis]